MELHFTSIAIGFIDNMFKPLPRSWSLDIIINWIRETKSSEDHDPENEVSDAHLQGGHTT